MRRWCAVLFALVGSAGGVIGPTSASGATGLPSVVVNATVPAAIASDCSRDVTAPIREWIATVPDGATLNFTPSACYRVDGTLLILRRNHLIIDGHHARFRAVTDGSELVDPSRIRTRSMWSLMRSNDIIIRNTIVVGANPYAGRGELAYKAKFEAQHAYLIQASHGVVLDHVEAYDVYGDFVYTGTSANNVVVRSSTFSRNGRQGWTINGTDILFEKNFISETRRATIDMEPASAAWQGRNVTIRNNTIGKGRLYFFASAGAAATIDNITIIGNRLVGKEMSMHVNPPQGTRSNYRVIGNVSDTADSENKGSILGFHDIVNLEVRDNVVPAQVGRGISGVGLRNCAHVIITNNRFRHAVAPILDRGLNVDVTQSENRIGGLSTVTPTSFTPGPTPTPVP